MNSEQLKAYIGVAHYVQQQANWNEPNKDSVQFIQNKPDIAKIEGDVSSLQSDVSRLQGDIVNIGNLSNANKSQIDTLISDVKNNTDDIHNNEARIDTVESSISRLNDIATKIPALSGSNITIGNVNNVFSFNKNPITINDNPNLIHWKCELIPTEQTSVSKIDIIADSPIEQIKYTKEIGYVGHTITLGNWGKYDIHIGDKITIEKINNIIVVEHILYLG
jgi:hypothetical protein